MGTVRRICRNVKRWRNAVHGVALDGRVYGAKSFPYNDLGACIDYNAQVLLVQKLLSELARDPGSGKFKDLHQQKDDQQLQPMQKPYLGGQSGWGSSGGSGTNP